MFLSSLGKTVEQTVKRTDGKSKNLKVEHLSGDNTFEIYLKAMPLEKASDLKEIKEEINSGNIIILKVNPIDNTHIEEIKIVIDDLCQFLKEVGGDIARLGEERIVVTPSGVKIWREKLTSISKRVSTAA